MVSTRSSARSSESPASVTAVSTCAAAARQSSIVRVEIEAVAGLEQICAAVEHFASAQHFAARQLQIENAQARIFTAADDDAAFVGADNFARTSVGFDLGCLLFRNSAINFYALAIDRRVSDRSGIEGANLAIENSGALLPIEQRLLPW